MKDEKDIWNTRYADHMLNEQQAVRWQQKIREVSGEAPEDVPAGETAPQACYNPWVENLPRSMPRRENRTGVWVFLILVALLLGIVAMYIHAQLPTVRTEYFFGEEYDRKDAEAVEKRGITIPTVAGGPQRVTVQAGHGPVLTAKQVFQAVNPAVVAVMGQYEDSAISVGTGVIFTPDGYFLTNAHVVQGSDACEIVLSDGQRYDAHLVGYDTRRDLAVLKALHAENLPVAQFGDSSVMEVGDKVYAIGNPLGMELRGTFTDGIISAVSRDVDIDGYTMELIQTNAALNEGNSGGPLINEFGQVIGLNTIKMSAGTGEVVVEGLGFAIPSAAVSTLANQILETGKTIPDTSIGIMVSPLTQNEENLRGLLIHSVTENSCGAKAGLRMGDVILSADGKPTYTNEDLLDIRRTHRPGDKMQMKILRGDKELDVTLTLDALE